jgi:hypothetical protein
MLPIHFLSIGISEAISISDLAAIVALIASPLIFWIGYSRTRKSEQIKIARELLESISMKYRKFDDFVDRNPFLSTTVQPKIYLEYIVEIIEEISYFIYLIKSHEIEKKYVITYHRGRVLWVLREMQKKRSSIEKLVKPEQEDLKKRVQSYKIKIESMEIMWTKVQ